MFFKLVATDFKIALFSSSFFEEGSLGKENCEIALAFSR